MADEAWSVAVPVGSKGEYLLSGFDPASILNFQYSFTLFFSFLEFVCGCVALLSFPAKIHSRTPP
jgi:hypothetical protein